MADAWTLMPTSGSPLLEPRNYVEAYDGNDDWDKCPICNAPHKECFYLPGVTNAAPPPTSG